MKKTKRISGVIYTAQEANDKGFFFRINGRNCKITSYKGDEECPMIPDYINGKPVRAIGRRAFFQKNIKKVILPKTLRVIMEEAFGESEIVSINLPESLVKIERGAFNRCRKLKSVNAENELNRNLEIKEKAFGWGVPYMEAHRFVILQDRLLQINTFGNSTITIPYGVRVIEEGAMQRTFHVRRIEIPETVEIIKDRAFAQADGCDVIVADMPWEHIRMGEDVFGTINYSWNNSNFAWKIIKNEIVSFDGLKNGWVTFRNFLISDSHRIQERTLYVPKSKVREFWDALKVKYTYDWNKGSMVVPYMYAETYYKLYSQCSRGKDKIQMAECILINELGGKMMMIEALVYLGEHINKVIKYAIINNKKESLMLYEKYKLLKDKNNIEEEERQKYGPMDIKFPGEIKINMRHTKYLMEKCNNEAAEYLKKFL